VLTTVPRPISQAVKNTTNAKISNKLPAIESFLIELKNIPNPPNILLNEADLKRQLLTIYYNEFRYILQVKIKEKYIIVTDTQFSTSYPQATVTFTLVIFIENALYY